MNYQETLEKALLDLYARQTAEEKRIQGTIHVNGMGFNGVDAPFCSSIAGQLIDGRELSFKQIKALDKLLRKYQKQLGHEIPEMDTEEKLPPYSKSNRAISKVNNGFKVSFDYNPNIVLKVKEIEGRRYDLNTKSWFIPKNSQVALLIFGKRFGFSGLETIETEAAKEIKIKEENLELNQSQDNVDLEISLGGILRPFQKVGVAYAIKNKRVLIADEMGLGKTVEALAAIQAQEAFPALVVCPAGLKFNWERETRKWLLDRTTSVINGNGNRFDAEIIILNYDILKKHKNKLEGIEFKSIIFDESHYCKNYKAQRTKLAKELAKRIPIRLALTGTPILNRPQELLSQLHILGRLDDLGGFWSFAKRYCGAYRDRYGLRLEGATNLGELNDRLRATCLIRRKKSEVLKELPNKMRNVIALDINNRNDYNKAEKDLIAWIKEQTIGDDETKEEKAQKASQAEQLVKIETLKQVAVVGKMDGIIDWIQNFLETGEKLVVFATHKFVIEALRQEFGCPTITGATPADERQRIVDRFQEDDSVNLLVNNIQAGGVGITLTAASNVAFVEFGWNPAVHDQAEDRVHRIGQDDAVTAWYLIAKDTIDEDIVELIDKKRLVVNEAIDGDVGDTNGGILLKLFDRLAKDR